MLKMLTSGLLFLSAVVLLSGAILSGCVSRNEARMAEAQAKADIARYQSQETQARADAQIGVAKAESQAEIVREQEKTQRETAWLGVLPWLLLIVVVGGGVAGAVWLVIWWRGRLHLEVVRVQAGAMMLPAPSPLPALPQQRSPVAGLLPGPVARRAQETGAARTERQGDVWVLYDEEDEVIDMMARRR